ncbi:Arc family DNA-binding protein [Proteus mirabilis]|uniref:Arc family DNA-binding protein n=1 Tax=Proteus mirabilis TaxID=584 RepID=UPI0005374148|nr:Arc family DNA-binding protein [Proteus mirabilis]AUU38622.1 Arc family DNA-binding protein [Proteus mirabilis]
MKGMRNIAPFGLRMPDELKEKIQERAKANGRSMNSEIIQMLQYAIDEAEHMDRIVANADADMERDPTLGMSVKEKIEYYKNIDPAKVEILKLQQKQWEETSALIDNLVSKGLLK